MLLYEKISDNEIGIFDSKDNTYSAISLHIYNKISGIIYIEAKNKEILNDIDSKCSFCLDLEDVYFDGFFIRNTVPEHTKILSISDIKFKVISDIIKRLYRSNNYHKCKLNQKRSYCGSAKLNKKCLYSMTYTGDFKWKEEITLYELVYLNAIKGVSNFTDIIKDNVISFYDNKFNKNYYQYLIYYIERKVNKTKGSIFLCDSKSVIFNNEDYFKFRLKYNKPKLIIDYPSYSFTNTDYLDKEIRLDLDYANIVSISNEYYIKSQSFNEYMDILPYYNIARQMVSLAPDSVCKRDIAKDWQKIDFYYNDKDLVDIYNKLDDKYYLRYGTDIKNFPLSIDKVSDLNLVIDLTNQSNRIKLSGIKKNELNNVYNNYIKDRKLVNKKSNIVPVCIDTIEKVNGKYNIRVLCILIYKKESYIYGLPIRLPLLFTDVDIKVFYDYVVINGLFTAYKLKLVVIPRYIFDNCISIFDELSLPFLIRNKTFYAEGEVKMLDSFNKDIANKLYFISSFVKDNKIVKLVSKMEV